LERNLFLYKKLEKMNKEPFVSIIIPTFDRPTLLKRAVKSVIGQTYSNFEIVIVDDSIENPAKKDLKPFLRRNLKYIRLKQHSGAAISRNTGIRNAEGDYICFLDDDDEYLPNFLEDLIRLLRDSQNAQMAIGAVILSDEKGNRKMEPRISIKEDFLRELIPQPCIIPINSFILNKKNIEYFDTMFSYYEDVDYVIRLAKKGLRFIYTDIPVAIYHCDQQRYRNVLNTKRDIEIGERLIKKHKDILSENSFYYSKILFNHVCKIYNYGNVARILPFLRDSFTVGSSYLYLKHLLVFISIFFSRIVKTLREIFLFSKR